MTDAESFAVLEPLSDGFRNFLVAEAFPNYPPESLLVDKASMLNLSSPEMAVLLAGLRSLGAVVGDDGVGVLTATPGVLTNDFFVNLLDMGTTWRETSPNSGMYEGRDRSSDALKWTASRVDLVFGSNSELRAVAEYYGSADAKAEFALAFIGAWTKVMNADRFEVDLSPEKISAADIAALKHEYLSSAPKHLAKL